MILRPTRLADIAYDEADLARVRAWLDELRADPDPDVSIEASADVRAAHGWEWIVFGTTAYQHRLEATLADDPTRMTWRPACLDGRYFAAQSVHHEGGGGGLLYLTTSTHPRQFSIVQPLEVPWLRAAELAMARDEVGERVVRDVMRGTTRGGPSL